MSDDHPNREILERAEAKMKAIASEVNERMRDGESASKVLAIHAELEGSVPDLVTPTRRLLKDADVQVSSLGDPEKKSRKYYLFNDLLLITSKDSGGFFKSGGSKVRYNIDLTKAIIVPGKDEDCMFSIKFSQNVEKGGVTVDKVSIYLPALAVRDDLMEATENAVQQIHSKEEEVKERRASIEGKNLNQPKKRAWATAGGFKRGQTASGTFSPLSPTSTPEKPSTSGVDALKALEEKYSLGTSGGETMKRMTSVKMSSNPLNLPTGIIDDAGAALSQLAGKSTKKEVPSSPTTLEVSPVTDASAAATSAVGGAGGADKRRKFATKKREVRHFKTITGAASRAEFSEKLGGMMDDGNGVESEEVTSETTTTADVDPEAIETERRRQAQMALAAEAKKRLANMGMTDKAKQLFS